MAGRFLFGLPAKRYLAWLGKKRKCNLPFLCLMGSYQIHSIHCEKFILTYTSYNILPLGKVGSTRPNNMVK